VRGFTLSDQVLGVLLLLLDVRQVLLLVLLAASAACRRVVHAARASVERQASFLLVVLAGPLRSHVFFVINLSLCNDSWVLLLKRHENTFASFRYQASYNFLGYILGGVVEQLLKLKARELVDHVFLAADRGWVLSFKLIQLLFLLKHILYQSASTVSHFAEPVAESHVQQVLVEC
jgi:hypothetical protein